MPLEMIRRPDKFGLALVAGLAIAFLGIGGAVVFSGLVTLSQLLLGVPVGIALVASYHRKQSPPAYRNTFAHGSARLADERETHAASGGVNKAPALHDQTFEN